MDKEASENRVNHRTPDRDDHNRRLSLHQEYKVICIKQEPGEHGHYRISQLGIRLGEEVLLLDVTEVVELVRMGKRF